jgi:membrane-associated phospholipid phosphatase
MTRPLLFAALLAGVATQPLAAQADSIRPFVTWRDAAILGAFTAATFAVAPMDTRIARELQDPGVQANRSMRRIADAVETITEPGSLIIGAALYGYGKLADKRRVAELGMRGTEALVIGGTVGVLIKGIAGRARPARDVNEPDDYQLMRGFTKGDPYQALPSGHSIVAFSVASSVTSQMKHWKPGSQWVVGPLLYGGAATVAWSRMYDNRHWASDVLAGAAIGTLTGLKVVHWHIRNPGNRLDRIFLGDEKESRLQVIATPSAIGLRWRN